MDTSKFIRMEQISKHLTQYQDYYFIAEDTNHKLHIINSTTEKELKPTGHRIDLTTKDGESKGTNEKDLYKACFGAVYCIDNISNLPNEEWKVISGTENKYYISNIGRVKSYCKYEAQLLRQNPNKNENGYLRVDIAIDGITKHRTIHSLVAEVFLEPPTAELKNPEIHHIDGNRFNNRADNLIWISQEQHKKIHSQQQTKKDESIAKYQSLCNEINAGTHSAVV